MQWPAPPDFAEHRSVLAARHLLWRRRQVDLRFAQSAGKLRDFLGAGRGLSLYDLGQQGGSQFITLLQSEIPAHTHQVKAAPALVSGDTNIGPGNAFAKSSQGNAYTPLANPTNLAFQAVSVTGGDQPHNNMMPYLTVNYCIALQGVFPPRQ